MTERQKQFIKINHHFMTMSEMAEELQIAYNSVSNFCIYNFLKPITVKERMAEYVKKWHKKQSIQEMANHLKVSENTIREHCRETDIHFMSQAEKDKMIKHRKKSLFTTLDEEIILEEFGKLKPIGNIKRPPAVYNQSGSEFTDKIRGITTTKRTNSTAQDAFFK